jgi:hypothetical protein
VARLEILEHRLKLLARLFRRHFEHFADQTLGPVRRAALAAPRNVERPDDHAGRIGMKPQAVGEQIHRDC